MQSLKMFCELLKKTKRTLHLAANSSILDNSCWELRKQARQSALSVKVKRRSSYDQQFYRSLDQRYLNRNRPALKSNVDAQRSTVEEEFKAVPKQMREERMDLTYYKPKSLGDRCYDRTWADFKKFENLEPEHHYCATMHPPARKRIVRHNHGIAMAPKKFKMATASGKSNAQKKNRMKPNCFKCNRTNQFTPTPCARQSSTF